MQPAPPAAPVRRLLGYEAGAIALEMDSASVSQSVHRLAAALQLAVADVGTPRFRRLQLKGMAADVSWAGPAEGWEAFLADVAAARPRPPRAAAPAEAEAEASARLPDVPPDAARSGEGGGSSSGEDEAGPEGAVRLPAFIEGSGSSSSGEEQPGPEDAALLAELLSEGPLAIFDGGHSPRGAAAAAR